MAGASYRNALKHVLVYEGGYVNHPKDPGGPTMKGVTQRVYDAFRDRAGQARRPVRQIADEELQAIYKRQYWDAARGDDLPAGVDFVVFDGAVNSGVSRSVRWLQTALGVKADGHIGEATLAAAQNHPDHDALISKICEIRMRFLKSLKTWRTFGTGWSRRVKSVNDIGCGMTDSPHVAEPIEHTEAFEADTNGKADGPPVSEQKTGITEGTAVTSGFTFTGLLYLAWQKIEEAPASILDAMIANPAIPILGVVVLGLGYIGYRRFVQKQVVD